MLTKIPQAWLPLSRYHALEELVRQDHPFPPKDSEGHLNSDISLGMLLEHAPDAPDAPQVNACLEQELERTAPKQAAVAIPFGNRVPDQILHYRRIFFQDS